MTIITIRSLQGEEFLDVLLNFQMYAFRAPMSRILDVANTSGMEAGAGSFSAHITNPLLHFNEGNWKFESIDRCLQVSRANEADSGLTIPGLSALVFGAHDLEDFSLRGWGNPTPGSRLSCGPCSRHACPSSTRVFDTSRPDLPGDWRSS